MKKSTKSPMKKPVVKKAQMGTTTTGKVDPKKYLEESRKRVSTTTDSLRKNELKKGIVTYDDYLKSKIKTGTKKK
jgi:DNA-directed RNA polymerase subunit L